jgi:hypothetical protein
VATVATVAWEAADEPERGRGLIAGAEKRGGDVSSAPADPIDDGRRAIGGRKQLRLISIIQGR